MKLFYNKQYLIVNSFSYNHNNHNYFNPMSETCIYEAKYQQIHKYSYTHTLSVTYWNPHILINVWVFFHWKFIFLCLLLTLISSLPDSPPKHNPMDSITKFWKWQSQCCGKLFWESESPDRAYSIYIFIIWGIFLGPLQLISSNIKWE